MSEMQRWLDADDLDDETRELLRAAPLPRAMTAPERARSARALGRIAALPAAAGLTFWLQNVALAGVLGAAGGFALSAAVLWIDGSPPAPSSAPPALTLPQSSSPEPAPSALPAATREAPAAPHVRARNVAPPRPSAAPAPDSLALEAAQLEKARRALGSDPGAALEMSSEHARDFPDGKLGAERELLAIDALSRLGRRAEALSRARAMLARSRGGLYEARLRKMIESLE